MADRRAQIEARLNSPIPGHRPSDGDVRWLLDALAEAEAERDALRDRALAAEAKVARVEAVVTDWGAGTVHRPRSTYYGRLRAALEEKP